MLYSLVYMDNSGLCVDIPASKGTLIYSTGDCVITFAGNSLVEFNNHYNEDTSLFEIMQTNIGNKGVSNDENVDEIRVG